MTKRCRFALLLAVLVAGMLATLPAVHWRVIGWIKWEAFYAGRPTRFWADEICHYRYRGGSFAIADWRQRFLLAFGSSYASPWVRPDVLNGDPASVPVLLELLQDQDRWVRWEACSTLLNMANESPSLMSIAIPAATTLLDDPDWYNRSWAIDRLAECGPAARPAIRRLFEIACCAPHPLDRKRAIATIRKIDREAAGEFGAVADETE